MLHLPVEQQKQYVRCSAGNAVEQKEGNLTFNVTIPEKGFHNMDLQAVAPGGDKINKLEVGSNSLDFLLKQNNQ